MPLTLWSFQNSARQKPKHTVRPYNNGSQMPFAPLYTRCKHVNLFFPQSVYTRDFVSVYSAGARKTCSNIGKRQPVASPSTARCSSRQTSTSGGPLFGSYCGGRARFSREQLSFWSLAESRVVHVGASGRNERAARKIFSRRPASPWKRHSTRVSCLASDDSFSWEKYFRHGAFRRFSRYYNCSSLRRDQEAWCRAKGGAWETERKRRTDCEMAAWSEIACGDMLISVLCRRLHGWIGKRGRKFLLKIRSRSCITLFGMWYFEDSIYFRNKNY